jgi:hypothetical protein
MTLEPCSEVPSDSPSDFSPDTALVESEEAPPSISLTDFVTEFGDELLDSLNRSNPPVYTGTTRPERERVLAGLKRQCFPAQAQIVHAAAQLLIDQNARAVVINGNQKELVMERSITTL